MEKIVTLSNLAQYKALSEKQNAVQLKLLTDNIAALIGSVIETTSFTNLRKNNASCFYEDVAIEFDKISFRKTGNGNTYVDTNRGECFFQYSDKQGQAYSGPLYDAATTELDPSITSGSLLADRLIYPVKGSRLKATFIANTTLTCEVEAAYVIGIKPISCRKQYTADRHPIVSDIHAVEITYQEDYNSFGGHTTYTRQFPVVNGEIIGPTVNVSGQDVETKVQGKLKLLVNGPYGGMITSSLGYADGVIPDNSDGKITANVDFSSIIKSTDNGLIHDGVTLIYEPVNNYDSRPPIKCDYDITLSEDNEDITNVGRLTVEDITEHGILIYNGYNPDNLDDGHQKEDNLSDFLVEAKITYSDGSITEINSCDFRTVDNTLYSMQFFPDIRSADVRRSLREPNNTSTHTITADLNGMGCHFTYTADPADLREITRVEYNGPADTYGTSVDKPETAILPTLDDETINHSIYFLKNSLTDIKNYTVYCKYDNEKEYILRSEQYGITVETKKPFEAVIADMTVTYSPEERFVSITATQALGGEDRYFTFTSAEDNIIFNFNGNEVPIFSFDSSYTIDNPLDLNALGEPSQVENQKAVLTTELNENRVVSEIPLEAYKNKVIQYVNYESAKNFVLSNLDKIFTAEDVLIEGPSQNELYLPARIEPGITTDIFNKKVKIENGTANLYGDVYDKYEYTINNNKYYFSAKDNINTQFLENKVSPEGDFSSETFFTEGTLVEVTEEPNSKNLKFSKKTSTYNCTKTEASKIEGKIKVTVNLSAVSISNNGENSELVTQTGNTCSRVYIWRTFNVKDTTEYKGNDAEEKLANFAKTKRQDLFSDSIGGSLLNYCKSKKDIETAGWTFITNYTNSYATPWGIKDSNNYKWAYISKETYSNGGSFYSNRLKSDGPNSESASIEEDSVNIPAKYVVKTSPTDDDTIGEPFNVSLRSQENVKIRSLTIPSFESTYIFSEPLMSNFDNTDNNCMTESKLFNKITLNPASRTATVEYIEG